MIRIIRVIFSWLYDIIYGGIKVTVYLKSGNKVTFRAKKATFSKSADKIHGYSIIKMNKVDVWFELDQIEAIVIN